MNTPYKPISQFPSLLVKVYDSNTKSVYWLNRSFSTTNNVVNSYVHRKNWEGTVYCVYNYPSFSFKELLTYTDSGVRVLLNCDEAKDLAGAYEEGWGIA